MLTDRVKCNKCGLYIISQNKLVHDAQCNPIRHIQNSTSTRNIQTNTTRLLNNSRDNRIIYAKNNNIEEEFWYCTMCQNYMDIKEKTDHILCHQYQDEHSNHENTNRTDEMTRDELNSMNTYENPFSRPYIRVNRNENYINNTSYRNNPYESNFITQTNTNPFLNNTNRNIINSDDPFSNFNRRAPSQISFNGIDFSSEFSNPQSQTTITRTINHPEGGTTVITTTSNGNSQSIRTVSTNLNNNYQNSGNVYYNPFISNDQMFSDAFLLHPHSNHLESILRQIQERINTRQNPVNENLISALPEMEINDLSKIPDEKKDCVICLTTYELNEKVIILPCTHMFHTDCLKSWFRNQDTCPICKFKINESSIIGG